MTLAAPARRLVHRALLALCAATLLVPASAAAQPLTVGLYDPLFSSPDPLVRDHWLAEATGASAGIVRIGVPWSAVATAQPPTDATATEPGWPGYDWDRIDETARSAAAHGLKIMFTVANAPRWAEGPNRPGSARFGTWMPDPVAFGEFGEALARRYDGDFPDPASPGATLPRVRYFEAWNEPNLDYYLSPQWYGHQLFGAGWYRDMLNSFYAAVKSVQPDAKVIGPATAPFGDRPGGERSPPVLFLRSLFCMKVGHLANRGCPAQAHLDIFSHHPIDVGRGPNRHTVNPLDVSTLDFSRLSRILRRAVAIGRVLPPGNKPLWVSELWWDTNPPDHVFGVSPAKQARWIELSDYLLWAQGVSVVITLPMVDIPLVRPDFTTLQSGIFFVNGRRKPSYATYRFPFLTRRLGESSVLAWGKSPTRGLVRIQRFGRGGWTTVRRLRAVPEVPFQAKLTQRGSARFRALRGDVASRPWQQG